MMHQQIKDEEIIERYVRKQLSEEERKSFEEHFFGCDECFEKLQVTERFVAGVRDAARRGTLADPGSAPAKVSRLGAWWIPAFGVSAAAALLLAALSGWMYFSQIPKMQDQLAKSAAELRAQQDAHAALEQQLRQSLRAENNVPLAMLEASRDVQAKPLEIALPANAPRLILWVEPGAAKYRDFRIEVLAADGSVTETLENVERNSYGALAVSLPSNHLQPGQFRIRLSGANPPPASLLAEYTLRIRRP